MAKSTWAPGQGTAAAKGARNPERSQLLALFFCPTTGQAPILPRRGTPGHFKTPPPSPGVVQTPMTILCLHSGDDKQRAFSQVHVPSLSGQRTCNAIYASNFHSQCRGFVELNFRLLFKIPPPTQRGMDTTPKSGNLGHFPKLFWSFVSKPIPPPELKISLHN